MGEMTMTVGNKYISKIRDITITTKDKVINNEAI